MRLRSTLGIAGLIMGILLFAFSPASAVSATFAPNRIIDDFVFDNTTTMTSNSIDSWLNTNFGSASCISTAHGFSAPDPTGYNPTQGFLYGGNVSAGQVIYDAAQAYDINPEVLLSTLQKEQSLVSGSAGCSTLQYAAAAGYGCLDGGTTYNYSGVDLYSINGVTVTSVSGTCVNTSLKVGFSQQVIRAAWLLKFGEQRSEGNVSWAIISGNWDNSDDPQSCYDGPMTQGTFARCPSGGSSYYDGYTTIDGTAVHMDTGGTASLYWYTPHFSGNQNFFNIFTNWFGLPYANDTLTPHPDGTLVSDGQHVYLINNSTREMITTGTVFYSYGYPWSAVKQSSTGDNNLSLGTSISDLAPGTIATDGDGKVYLISSVSGVAQKQWLSLSMFNTLGYKWDQIVQAGQSDLPSSTIAGMVTSTQHPDGTLVTNAGKVYLVDQSTLRYVSSLAFATNYYQWNRLVPATTADLALASGTDVGLRQGAMLYSDSSIFVINYDSNGVLKQPVGPWECYADRLHYTSNDWYAISDSLLPTRTGSLFTC